MVQHLLTLICCTQGCAHVRFFYILIISETATTGQIIFPIVLRGFYARAGLFYVAVWWNWHTQWTWAPPGQCLKQAPHTGSTPVAATFLLSSILTFLKSKIKQIQILADNT